MRWANDKYKGILAFRATLRNGDEDEGQHELLNFGQPRYEWHFLPVAGLETLLAISCTVPILGRQLLMWHATEAELSTSRRGKKNVSCTTLAATYKVAAGAKCAML